MAPAASDDSPTRAPPREPARGGKDKAKPVDEFDRSWPRSGQPAHQASQRDPPPHTSSTVSAPPPPRNLFNERSNRLEPVPPHTSQSRWKQDEPSPAPTLFTKRGGLRPAEHALASLERDHPPHISQPGQLSTQRPGAEARPTERAWQQGSALRREPSVTPTGAWGQPDTRMRDAPPHVARQLSSHEQPGPTGQTAPIPKLASSSPHVAHARRPSDAPSVPEPPPKEAPLPVASIPPQESTPQPESTPQQVSIPQQDVPPPEAAPLLPAAVAPKPAPVDALSYEEASKAVLQNAAERARQRRQQEEEEREAQRERARQKAAELERMLSPVPEPTPPSADKVPLPDQKPVSVRIYPFPPRYSRKTLKYCTRRLMCWLFSKMLAKWPRPDQLRPRVQSPHHSRRRRQ